MPKRRRGMTLIEVMFAIVIMSGVMLALARFGQGFTRATRNAANLSVASDLAMNRLELVLAHPSYEGIDSFVATEDSADESANPSMEGRPGFTRTTSVAVSDAPAFRTVTVTVTSAALTAPVTKTAIIAAF